MQISINGHTPVAVHVGACSMGRSKVRSNAISRRDMLHEADGFHVLDPGAPLDLQLPIGRLRYPAEPSMRHLVRPLAGHVSYEHGALAGLLASQ
ncbi:hypothetical protein UK15_36995 [Streptomyces variegatus]|uniref:Uncharacterized protein n=1 Tax=Streptomyces variegatus TaxID=284040 RepID=A0A0M2GBU0_9ACTN|nr:MULTISPECIES: hypothetical protein [Streptomyces]KJK34242.1 hypothetical protein UK15_36995 [Streptomyces variegatus]